MVKKKYNWTKQVISSGKKYKKCTSVKLVKKKYNWTKQVISSGS